MRCFDALFWCPSNQSVADVRVGGVSVDVHVAVDGNVLSKDLAVCYSTEPKEIRCSSPLFFTLGWGRRSQDVKGAR